ncbi:hypothetical protein B0H13DRAFT_1653820 [Mycena leptocephala]|nr:hypothetical protein B0H13DRAFT_1653820 [Mycena leptocephala]
MNCLALYFRVFATGACCTLFLLLHVAFYWTRGLSASSIVAPRYRGIGLQKSYAYGEWVSDPATSNTSECDLQVMQQIDLVREQGGWLLTGDSTAEDYFISWLCLLSPHRATPDYTQSPYFDWAQQKDIYLDPDSLLVSSLTFPDGFSIAMTLWRVDLPPNLDLGSNDFIIELLRIFTAPLLSANYKTMMVSTAGHWTMQRFSGYRDERREGDVEFLEHVVRKWATDVQQVPRKANRLNAKQRQVVVRPYLHLLRHEDCQSLVVDGDGRRTGTGAGTTGRSGGGTTATRDDGRRGHAS